VKSGATAFDHVYGASKWQSMAERHEEAGILNAAMASFSSVVAAAMVAAYDFSSSQTIVDVGGGSRMGDVLRFPSPNVAAGLVENSLVVCQANLSTRFRIK
jgi:O-methyltransferase domain